jgi:hypothetical protein
MRIHYNATLISAIVLSLFLMAYIPESLKFASTWRELYFQMPGLREQNLLMPLGLHVFGFATIGLIVLWTGYIKNERWAWFVLLIILLFLIFPQFWLSALIEKMLTPGPSRLFTILTNSRYWPHDMRTIVEVNRFVAGFVLDLISLPVMLIALLLPIRSFFRRSHQIEGNG